VLITTIIITVIFKKGLELDFEKIRKKFFDQGFKRDLERDWKRDIDEEVMAIRRSILEGRHKQLFISIKNEFL
jgi:hypothetical protein